jgi:hypothetical protein
MKTDIESWHLAITINHLPEPLLTEDSGYLMRKDNPSRYRMSTVSDNGNRFVVMTDTQVTDFGEVAFILHGSMSANISLVGDNPAGSTPLQNTLQAILASWRWQ